jgi:hypothetical protein
MRKRVSRERYASTTNSAALHVIGRAPAPPARGPAFYSDYPGSASDFATTTLTRDIQLNRVGFPRSSSISHNV